MAYVNDYTLIIDKQMVNNEVLTNAMKALGIDPSPEMVEYGMKLAKGEEVTALTKVGRKVNDILNDMAAKAETAKAEIETISHLIEVRKAAGKPTKAYEEDLRDLQEVAKLPESINIEVEGEDVKISPAEKNEGYLLEHLAAEVAKLLSPAMSEKDSIAKKRATADYEKSATRVAVCNLLHKYVS